MDDLIAEITNDILKEFIKLDEIFCKYKISFEKIDDNYWFSYSDDSIERSYIYVINIHQFQLYLRHSTNEKARNKLMSYVLGSRDDTDA